jgi:hypothetical protein
MSVLQKRYQHLDGNREVVLQCPRFSRVDSSYKTVNRARINVEQRAAAVPVIGLRVVL